MKCDAANDYNSPDNVENSNNLSEEYIGQKKHKYY